MGHPTGPPHRATPQGHPTGRGRPHRAGARPRSWCALAFGGFEIEFEVKGSGGAVFDLGFRCLGEEFGLKCLSEEFGFRCLGEEFGFRRLGNSSIANSQKCDVQA